MESLQLLHKKQRLKTHECSGSVRRRRPLLCSWQTSSRRRWTWDSRAHHKLSTASIEVFRLGQVEGLPGWCSNVWWRSAVWSSRRGQRSDSVCRWRCSTASSDTRAGKTVCSAVDRGILLDLAADDILQEAWTPDQDTPVNTSPTYLLSYTCVGYLLLLSLSLPTLAGRVISAWLMATVSDFLCLSVGLCVLCQCLYLCVRGTGPAYFRHICIPTATLSFHVSLLSVKIVTEVY